MIEREEVIRIARLARLELSELEVAQYQKDLSNFLVSGRKLQKVDVTAVEGTAHALPITHELRQDKIGVSLAQGDVLALGSNIMAGFFKVPRIVEEQQ